MGDETYGSFARHRHATYCAGTNPTGLANDRRAALFAATKPERDEQAAQLDRVSSRIGGAILAFFATRVGQEYHGNDLRAHIAAACGPDVAPDSARRIAAQLKARGAINYECVDRAKSLFRALAPNPKPGEGEVSCR